MKGRRRAGILKLPRTRLVGAVCIALFLLAVPFLLTQINQSLIPYFARFKLTSPGGIPPIASFAYLPTIPTPGEMITFDASRSYDLDGSVVSYEWSFGDGNLSAVTNPKITHSYPIDGNYTVKLTVTDDNGLTGIATAVVQVSTEVFFRVVVYGTLTPLSGVSVTVYFQNGSAWVPAPTGRHALEVKYDSATQPDLANTEAERYRNPGTTATILFHDASNIGFDIRPASKWTVFFKFQWGPYVTYWPNQTTRVYNYKAGEIESHDYIPGHEAYWDSTASTYVIKANDIPGHGVAPTSYHPIIVGILAPPPPTMCYLTVRTDPSDVTAISGEGWHANGTDVVLTAPETVSVSSGSRYSFTYWDVDGTPGEIDDNVITVTMNTNHTATAHYRLQYAVVFGVSGLSDATGTVVTVDSVSKTLADLPFTKWVNDSDSVTYSYNALVESGTLGKRFRLDSVSGPASPVVVTAQVNVTGNYVTQYSVTFAQTGLDETAVGTVVTINGVAKVYSELPNVTWVDAGSSVTYSYSDVVLSSVSGKRFRLVSVECPTSPFVVTKPVTITGNYKTQYQVTFDQTGVGSDFTGTVVTVDGVSFPVNLLPNSTWLDSGSSHIFSFASPLAVDGKQYVWSSTSGLSTLQSGTLVITASGSVIGNYTVQGQVTFQITFDQIGVGSDFTGAIVVIDDVSYGYYDLPASFLWNEGSVHSFAFQSPLTVGVNSKRYVWNGTSGLSGVQSGSITVVSNGSVVGSYETQYYLTLATDSLPPVGEGWYDDGAFASISVPQYEDIVPGSSRYSFIGWTTPDMSEITDPQSPSTTVFMDASKTVTVNCKVQYTVTFDQSGVASDFTGTVVTVDGAGYTVSMLPTPVFWWDSGSSHAFAFWSPLIVDVNKSYDWISTTGLSTIQNGSLLVTGSGSVTGNYAAHSNCQITFEVIGLDTDAAGTIVTVDGLGYNFTVFPFSFLWDTGSSHAYSFTMIIDVGSGKRYVLDSVTGLSTSPSGTIAVTVSGSIVGHYKTQYYLTLVTNPSGVSSPSGEGWYDSGTLAPISSATFVDIIAGSSRYGFNDWSTVDMSEITDPSASSTTVLMDRAKTVTANYTIQHSVTFNQSGVDSDYTGTVVVVDGVNYSRSGLPMSFWWDEGSTHVFYYGSSLVVAPNAKKYVWFSTSGLSSQQSESFTLTTSGSITGNYNAQYYLTVASAYDSPKPLSGWFDSGANITAYVTSPVSGPLGTQYVCTGWTGTGSVPASGAVSSLTFTITSPSSITWTWKTQYYLWVRTVPAGVANISGEGWYDISATVPLSAPLVADYDFNYWDVDGNAQGANVTSIVVIMNAPHTATAHYSQPPAAPVGGRTVAFLKSTQASLVSIYVLLIASLSAAFILTRRKRK